MPAIPLNLLYQDSDYVAIDKPAGLLVHRSGLAAEASIFALQLLRDQLGQAVFPCHRLDRPTSGVLLFALSREALSAAQEALATQTAQKTYLAIVRGWTEQQGFIDYPLRSEIKPSKLQDAVTRYHTRSQSTVDQPIGRYAEARFSLLELTPETGRTHQLRRHLAHIRHPILGDTRHGDGAQNRFLREYCGGQHLMLRAIRLVLPLPHRVLPLTIEAPIDPEFERITRCLALDGPTSRPMAGTGEWGND